MAGYRLRRTAALLGGLVLASGALTGSASADARWRFSGSDVVHLESANGKARVVGGVNWYTGHPKFWLQRAETYRGTKAYAPRPVGCIWVRVSMGYPTGSVNFPPTGGSISGASVIGNYLRKCRNSSERRPRAIRLDGVVSYAKAYLHSVTFTVCTSPRAADGPRFCANQKVTFG